MVEVEVVTETMPKFIGRKISGAEQIEDNARPNSERLKLTYSQAVKLRPSVVMYSLDTTDRGGKGSLAKRWYRWFARPEDIFYDPGSTKAMLQLAGRHLHPKG